MNEREDVGKMPRGNDAIKIIEGAIGLGFRLSEAVQRALGTSLTAFGLDRRFPIQSISQCLSGYESRVYPEVRDAICEALDIPRAYLDRLIENERARRAKEGAA